MELIGNKIYPNLCYTIQVFCLPFYTHTLVLSNCDRTVLSEKKILKAKTFEDY